MNADPVINHPPVVEAVRQVFAEYERALVENRLDQLDNYFWDSEFTVRFGVAENLYGAAAIAAYRRQCDPVGRGRCLSNTVVTTFGEDFATVSTEFSDGQSERRGRQMQTWVRFAERWRVVAAHVSMDLSSL